MDNNFLFHEINELLEYIDKLTANKNNENRAKLIALSEHREAEIRMRALEGLSTYLADKDILKIYRDRAKDIDEIVRTTAIEMIGNAHDERASGLLFTAISDSSQLVRTSAIISLGQLYNEEVNIKLRKLYPSLSGAEKLAGAIALYHNGESIYLHDIFIFLSSEDYQLRCSAANLLTEFFRKEDLIMILTKLRNCFENESSVAVKSSLEYAIAELSQLCNKL